MKHRRSQPVKSTGRIQGQTERKIEKDALAAIGRGACVELGVPVADDSARFNDWLGGSDSDQDDRSRHNRNRRRRVHGDAELAVVGIAIERMDVRHLDHGQQRHQGQTQQSCCPESAWLWVATIAEIRLQSCEQKHLQLQGYIGLDATGAAGVPLSAGFTFLSGISRRVQGFVWTCKRLIRRGRWGQ